MRSVETERERERERKSTETGLSSSGWCLRSLGGGFCSEYCGSPGKPAEDFVREKETRSGQDLRNCRVKVKNAVVCALIIEKERKRKKESNYREDSPGREAVFPGMLPVRPYRDALSLSGMAHIEQNLSYT